MGTPRTTANLKLITGRSPGRDSAGRVVAKPVARTRVAPDKPADLPAEASAEWDRVATLLDSIEVLAGNLHRGQLIAYVRTWAHYVDLEAEVAKHGRTQTVVVRDNAGGSTRKRIRSPEWDMLTTVRADLRRYAADFGLTPAAEAAAHAAAQAMTAGPAADLSNPFAN
ncbi:P27 family phage terminase small subunit [Williamsia muralis]|uniref:P27 family phage terminase small subunit n=1 Tax=Williamsia marianensis TaxID=85044 RepID=A0ABU4EXK5_WILMA|nr:P27 family phage terminase small subunit [Williamsia muralis]MDV7135486.1 P27 family phage terminase small subunit [Williamsia muralis]